jgi:hypothetical protein
VLLPKGQNLGPKLLLKILRQELGIVLRRLRRRNAACGLRRRAPTPTSALTDKAEVLRPYWTQRNDPAMEAALSAIRQRAEYEIGVRSKPLEKEQAKRADRTSFPEENKSGKVATLKTAGITPKAALASEALTELVTAKDVDAFCKIVFTQISSMNTSCEGAIRPW